MPIEKNIKEIQITTEYITLGGFLKFAGIIAGGGMAKEYLQTKQIFVNGENEQRRGRKLVGGDNVAIMDDKINVNFLIKYAD